VENRFILTPYFIDRPVDHFRSLAGEDWVVNAPPLPDGDLQERVSCLHRPLADFVAKTAAEGRRPVSFCGDCCSAIAVLAGLQRAGMAPTLIWFDAHGDFNTWQTSPSGFLGGMPLAMIAGHGEQRMARAVGLSTQPEARIVLSDARDLDPEEAAALAASKVVHLPDIGALLDRPLPEGPLYVHFDCDVIDSAEAPAQHYPAPDGPGATQVEAVFRRLAASGRVAAVSLCAWNPDRDPDRTTEATVLGAFRALIG
jgi:arginase